MTRSSDRRRRIRTPPQPIPAAQTYLGRIGAGVEDLFHHVLAVLHDPAYRESNAGALRMEWPRIPLPGWPDGIEDGAAETLAESAARGREIARLLDSESDVPGVTSGALRSEIAAIAVPSHNGQPQHERRRLLPRRGLGTLRRGPGSHARPRQLHRARLHIRRTRRALPTPFPLWARPPSTYYLNDRAYWKNVPAAVWNYKLGGYQVLKKWLSYRERGILGRRLTPEEVQHFTDTARRIAGLVLLVNE